MSETAEVPLSGVPENVYGDLTAMLDDVIISNLTIIIGLSMGVYGEIPEETASRFSVALGNATGAIIDNINEGVYALPTLADKATSGPDSD